MDKFIGLSGAEIERARKRFGANIISKKKRKSFFGRFIGNFNDPMIRVLLIALAINAALLFKSTDWFETAGIAFAVLVATLVSAISEQGSEAAFEKLQEQSLKTFCRVRRGGETMQIAVGDLVVGDIVLLAAGERIPADGTLVFGTLDVDQAALNGESKEAKKLAGNAGEGFLKQNALFSGTVVVGGEAVMRVDSVGDNTFYGKLAGELLESTRTSPLKLKLTELAKKISIIGYAGAFLAAVAYMFNVLVVQNMFEPARISAALSDYSVLLPCILKAATLAVTVIVMAVPEGLPMMVTVVLSANMKRMLKNNVLVRKLVGIETAGSMNILFTDKTGTLTRGKPEAMQVVLGDGTDYSVKDLEKAGESALNNELAFSLINNNASSMSASKAFGGNATDRALLELGYKMPHKRRPCKKIDSIPFCSERKLMATEVELVRGVMVQRQTDPLRIVLIKGAPEVILAACDSYMDSQGATMPFVNKIKLYNILNDMAGRAARVIAVASMEKMPEGELKNLRLIALVGIRDELRGEARMGVRQVTRAGISVVMITGDSPQTARAIAAECGIISKNTDIVLTSAELAKLSDEQLAQSLGRLKVVARALPQDKSRLVRIAQSCNLVVGMTGDGVNDAPALKRADVGFAMGSGTEVCKEAGDIIILDDNILSISKAASYGRTIFKSIRKFIIFQLTVNFCALAVSIIAPLIGVDTPITVIQMLWINLVIDTLAGLAFGGEQPRASYMKEPPKRRDEPIINRYMWQQIALGSAYSAILSIVFLKSPYFSRLFAEYGTIYSMTAFFLLFMFLAIFNSFSARTHRLNLLDYLALNKQFIFIMGALSLIQMIIVYFGGSVFRTVPLSLPHLLIIVLLAFSIVPIDLVRKALSKEGGT